MKQAPSPTRRRTLPLLAVVMLAAAVVLAGTTRLWWWPRLERVLANGGRSATAVVASPAGHDEEDTHNEEDGHDHGAGHDHAHAAGTHAGHADQHPGHDEATSIELSAAGLKNIGYRPLTVQLGSFERTITLPAMVVERPGRSQIHITAPLTGIITRIHALEGAAVEPDSLLFEVRLTHEELVSAQRDFLRTAENLDVIQREIERLRTVSEGVIAGRRVLEQEYEQQKLQASLRAEQQALLLHGLSEQQIAGILRDRQLLQSLEVRAPGHEHDDDDCSDDHLFHVQQLPVKLGQQVTAGELLCVLADHCELFLEGRAFEDDAPQLLEAARRGGEVTARLVSGRGESAAIGGLRVLYLSDRVDPETRALRFYVRLPNEVVWDQEVERGRRFIAWRFNPGQRMEVRVPVERWEQRIVLPLEAVVEDGAESYVYQRNGDHFDRLPVHVEYRDPQAVVVAADGTLKPGDTVAARGAYQMHLALKNRSSGGVDPHAGHNH